MVELIKSISRVCQSIALTVAIEQVFDFALNGLSQLGSREVRVITLSNCNIVLLRLRLSQGLFVGVLSRRVIFELC